MLHTNYYRKMSIKRRVPDKRRVSNELRGSEAHVVVNAGSQINCALLKQHKSSSYTLVTS